jgi:putative ABC transport system permease protein
MAITKLWTLDQQVSASIMRERMLSALSGFFACLGLLLAAIGVFGVMSYTVARRTSEIGIRMALGAASNQIARMVVREAVFITIGGLVIGLAAALIVARTITTLLFDVKPNDLLTAMTVTVLMTVTGIAAAYVPARRAVRIEPTLALRAE